MKYIHENNELALFITNDGGLTILKFQQTRD